MLYLPKLHLTEMASLDVHRETYGAKGGFASPGVNHNYQSC